MLKIKLYRKNFENKTAKNDSFSSKVLEYPLHWESLKVIYYLLQLEIPTIVKTKLLQSGFTDSGIQNALFISCINKKSIAVCLNEVLPLAKNHSWHQMGFLRCAKHLNPVKITISFAVVFKSIWEIQ